jgi:hypothetical protein
MDLNSVNAVTVDALKQAAVVAHKPDHQFALRRNTSIHGRVLQIRRFSILLKNEIDIRVGFRARINLAGTSFQLVTVGGRILKDQRFVGGSDTPAQARKQYNDFNHDSPF